MKFSTKFSYRSIVDIDRSRKWAFYSPGDNNHYYMLVEGKIIFIQHTTGMTGILDK